MDKSNELNINLFKRLIKKHDLKKIKMHDANSLKDTNVHYGVFSTEVYFVALDLNQYCFVSELEYFKLQPLH